MTERTVDSVPVCAWVYDDEETPLTYCDTGKPAAFYNCNESGPVCEEHICRCRPSLLTERVEKARRGTIERCLAGLRKLGVPESALVPVIDHLRTSGGPRLCRAHGGYGFRDDCTECKVSGTTSEREGA
jgi:hypothetical protein